MGTNPKPTPLNQKINQRGARITLPRFSEAAHSSLPRGRLTITQSLYCVIPGMKPEQVARGFSRWLSKVEQVYSRSLVVGTSWTAMDLGWLSSASQLVIENGKETYDRAPTSEEREADAGKILVIGAATDELAGAVLELFKVLPGESMRVQPLDVKVLRIRCLNGSTVATLTMTPE